MDEITRERAIERLRAALFEIAEEERSLCATVARKGLFCGGLARWSAAELSARLEEATGEVVDAQHLQAAAERLQLQKQALGAGRLPCDDASPSRGDPCWGWDEFYEGELARFLGELCGSEVCVRHDADAG